MKRNLKKIASLAAIVLVTTLTAFGQGGDAPFKKGSKTIGVSLGFGFNNYAYLDGYGYDVVNLPAIALTYDQGFFEDVGPGNIGIGGIIGFKTAYYNNNNIDKSHWNNYIVGVRGTYHLTLLADKNNKFDPYGGIMAGFRLYHYNGPTYYNGYLTNRVYFEKGLFIGAKYNFAKNFGVFGELGYDISLARVGLNFNF